MIPQWRKSLTIQKVTDRCDVTQRMRGSSDHFSISLSKAALPQMCLSLWKALLFFRVERSFNFPALSFQLGTAQFESPVCLRWKFTNKTQRKQEQAHTSWKRHIYNRQEISLWCSQILKGSLWFPDVSVKLGEDEESCKSKGLCVTGAGMVPEQGSSQGFSSALRLNKSLTLVYWKTKTSCQWKFTYCTTGSALLSKNHASVCISYQQMFIFFYLCVFQKYKDNINSDAYFPEQHHNAIE